MSAAWAADPTKVLMGQLLFHFAWYSFNLFPPKFFKLLNTKKAHTKKKDFFACGISVYVFNLFSLIILHDKPLVLKIYKDGI